LGGFGVVGLVAGELLANVLPRQRVERLSDFVEQLSERVKGLEGAFRAKLEEPAYAAVAEASFLAAVRTASSARRGDLAGLLKTGLSKTEAELVGHEAFVRLLDGLNDAQVIILASYRLVAGVLDSTSVASPDGGDEMYGVKTVGWFAAKPSTW
jgi:hypothetical protein